MTARADKMAASVLLVIAERLNSGATEIVLTRDEATVLVCWLARELFGEPSKFVEEFCDELVGRPDRGTA
jgi:hypothetical protein